MNTKNDVHVNINNREFVIYGYESLEYLQKVAVYLNNKMAECKETEGFSHMDREMQNIMLEINIVDELFKVQSRVGEVEAELKQKNEELYQLKHEFIVQKEKLAKLQEELNQVGQAYESCKRQLDKK